MDMDFLPWKIEIDLSYYYSAFFLENWYIFCFTQKIFKQIKICWKSKWRGEMAKELVL